MKRFFSLMTALVLVLSVAAAAGETFRTDYFTLELPDSWEIETEDLESEKGEQCLGVFGENSDIGLVAIAYLVYYENLKDIALWNSDEQELEAYTEAILEDYAENNPELLGIVQAGKIPLVLIKGTDGGDEFLYADTMTNGYAIEFDFFVTDADAENFFPFTDAYIEQVKTILATFQPVT